VRRRPSRIASLKDRSSRNVTPAVTVSATPKRSAFSTVLLGARLSAMAVYSISIPVAPPVTASRREDTQAVRILILLANAWIDFQVFAIECADHRCIGPSLVYASEPLYGSLKKGALERP
jgi:hypothetical protein